eukprot:TRINITY_DN46867_c0_g1_i1.p1 TRINITY_DN46867_c0_g1~~TRINITY_DN46867_c0_g1_i1.p1  ORF type:complete len:696 (+),score=242.78 TRINITY_DN46867_c0_g1_i1:89-2089(+)
MRSSLGAVAFAATAAAVRMNYYVDYTHWDFQENATLRGAVVYDDHRCTSSSKCPVVVVLPDKDGVDQYEYNRACMLADLGYVAFAADIYGTQRTDDWWPTDGTDALWSDAEQWHRNRTENQNTGRVRYFTKIYQSVRSATNFSFVDANKIAILGYDYGATGAFNQAISGHGQWNISTGILGVVANHALSTGLENLRRTGVTTYPKLLVNQGFSDTSLTWAQMATWETQLETYPTPNGDTPTGVTAVDGVIYQFNWYGSSVKGDFTKWDPITPSTTRNYNQFADAHSWGSTVAYLRELFGDQNGRSYLPPSKPTTSLPTSPSTRPYIDGRIDYFPVTSVNQRQGYYVYNQQWCTTQIKCPVVIIAHDQNGPTNAAGTVGTDKFEMNRARQIAQWGYFVYVIDLYGMLATGYASTVDTTANQQATMTNLFYDTYGVGGTDPARADELIKRLVEGIDSLTGTTGNAVNGLIDSRRMVVVGYGLGGFAACGAAIRGHSTNAGVTIPVGLLGAVAFHPVMNSNNIASMDPPTSATSRPALLVFSAADYNTNAEMKALADKMQGKTSDTVTPNWEIVRFGRNVKNDFTNWDDSNYNQMFDGRSWWALQRFLKEMFRDQGYDNGAVLGSTPPQSGRCMPVRWNVKQNVTVSPAAAHVASLGLAAAAAAASLFQ